MPLLVLISLATSAWPASAFESLSDVGWSVVETSRGDAVQTIQTERPALVLIKGDQSDAAALARSIHELAAVPMVLLSDSAGGASPGGPSGLDAIVSCGDLTTLGDALRPWWPLDADPVRERLAEMLGRDAYADLVARFGTQLREALAAIDEDGSAAARAHRLAGLAGTLGFPEVCEAWMPLSEGATDDRTKANAAAAARRVIQVIAHAGGAQND
jgi:hypothetical protein